MPFVYTVQGQYVTVLLAALHEMRGGNTKTKTIAHIEKMGWFDLPPEDLESYPTHQYEAIWHTKLAFARQWCVRPSKPLLMSDHRERDEWEISELGRERLLGVCEKFRTGIYDVREGHLWSLAFKKLLRPGYEPATPDVLDFV